MAPADATPLLSTDWGQSLRFAAGAAACAGQVGLAVLVGFSPRRGPGGNTFVLLALTLFAWGFFSLAHARTGASTWHLLDIASSPWAVPLTLRFVLHFVGRVRALRRLGAAAFAYFGALSLWSLGALVEPALLAGRRDAWWVSLMLLGLVPLAGLSAGLLWVHLRRSASAEERRRTRILLGALLAASALVSVELASGLGFDTPRLASLGALVASLGMGATALGLDRLARRPTRALVAGATAVAGLGSVGLFALTLFLGTGLAAAAVVLGTVGVGVLALGARWIGQRSDRRARLVGLVSMGRMAAQLAHDLKNPLAALKGAAQLLQGGVPPAETASLHTLILEQVDRLVATVDAYRRLGAVEPRCVPVEPSTLASSIVALRRGTLPHGLSLSLEAGRELPACSLDEALVGAALDNLLQNAIEAMPAGGRLVVRTGCIGESVFFEVEDTGHGMDPRTSERAFDDFFTTKAQGSGLGLAFVRRVALAHGGDVSLTSEEGAGTRVRMVLPRGETEGGGRPRQRSPAAPSPAARGPAPPDRVGPER